MSPKHELFQKEVIKILHISERRSDYKTFTIQQYVPVGSVFVFWHYIYQVALK